MTIKQFVGIFIVFSLLGYYHYEPEKTKPQPIVVVPNVEPKVIPDNKPEEVEPFFTKADKHRDVGENTIYGDVLNHSQQEPYGDGDGRRINVHETSHGITSDLRKTFTIALKKRVNVFYVLDSECIVLEESSISMRTARDRKSVV